MGNLCGGGLTAEQQKAREIDRMMERGRITDAHKIKLLLLGAGESGKSTFFKQMKLLYGDKQRGYTEQDKREYRKVVHKNIWTDMVMFLRCVGDLKGYKTPEAEEASQKLFEIAFDKEKEQIIVPKIDITPEMGAWMNRVWNDPNGQQAWEDRAELKLQVQDAFGFFMEDIEKIARPDFIPTVEQILRTRVRTSGVVHENFTVFATHLEIYDVGGQRNERRKWIKAFEDVTCVIFIAAISEYDQYLFEASEVNRQDESIELFHKQLEEEAFQRTSFILFLNKEDLFKEKLKKIPFRLEPDPSKNFPGRNLDFEGPHVKQGQDYESSAQRKAEFDQCVLAAENYLKGLYFAEKYQAAERRVVIHCTNSTDTDNTKKIIDLCKHTILAGNLVKGGWLHEDE